MKTLAQLPLLKRRRAAQPPSYKVYILWSTNSDTNLGHKPRTQTSSKNFFFRPI